MDVSPPSYRRFSSVRPGLVPENVDELPPYTRRTAALPNEPAIRRGPTEHIFFLTEKNKNLATLRLYSSAKSSKSLPTFFEKENINGILEIDAEKGDSIQSITAVVTGRIITGANAGDTVTFLNHSLPIWSKSRDVPRIPSPSEGASKAKLLGRCEWPLSIPLPRTVVAPNGTGSKETYHLPETFLERHTNASVQYDFTIHISRGLTRSDSRIKTAFGYIPNTRPAPPSELRQLAYHHGSPLLGPHSDPSGWKSLGPATARGVMYRQQPVKVECLLSLAKPLSYTRGSIIPCFMALRSSDENTLGLFSTPSAISVKLLRRVRFLNPDNLWDESVQEVGSASWWPSAGVQSHPNARHMEGEIKLAKDLRPSTAIGHFSVSYHVSLQQFDVPHYQAQEKRPLVSEPVEIATTHAKAPRPKAYAPPEYTSTVRPAEHIYAVPYSSGLTPFPT